MQLYLQMGHGMQSLALELLKEWGQGDIILSPVNTDPSKIVSYSKSIIKEGGSVLLDPQIFYPKEGNLNLRKYEYWPTEGVSIVSDEEYINIDRELLALNNEIGTDEIILPADQINEETLIHGLMWINSSAEYFRKKTNKKLLATLCIYPETIRNVDSVELIIDRLNKADVDGYYIVPQPSNSEYMVTDQLWMIGMMKLISCLKLMNKKVIVGYSNHQGLLYALANADAIASGTFMNTRSFVPTKFKYPRDRDIKQRSKWYYLPDTFSEYKVTTLDVAHQRGFLNEFEPHGDYSNDSSSILFKGARPSTTNYKERDSFKHYLHCLREQCKLISKDTYDDTLTTYELMLIGAENKINRFKKKGISGQNRDFDAAIEANRVAMYANQEDYGFRLSMNWGTV